MSNSSSMSNVGSRKAYESDDQKRYNTAEAAAIGATNSVNVAGHMDENKIINQLRDEDNQNRIDDRHKHEPGYTATMHGNEPSRGAKIDASIAEEEAELLEKKKRQTDGMPGKKMAPGTMKSDLRQELDEQEYEERAAHSKSGANTGKGGMEYISRKN